MATGKATGRRRNVGNRRACSGMHTAYLQGVKIKDEQKELSFGEADAEDAYLHIPSL